jgi:hypothetical protein
MIIIYTHIMCEIIIFNARWEVDFTALFQ